MASFNKIVVVGYLGRDPELRYTPNGTAVCNFSVATTEKRGDQETTTWFNVEAWGRQGELCNEYLAKGRQVYVEGRIRLEEYTDRDGNKRAKLVLTATDVKFLDSRGGREERGEAQNVTNISDYAGRRETLQKLEDEEIPF